MRLLAVIVAICMSTCVLLNTSPAQDAEPTKTDQIKPKNLIGGLFGQSMQSQLTEMATQVIDGYLTYLAKPETARKIAQFQKNYYDALVDQGFTNDQAFQLVREFGNPIAHGLSGD